MTSARIHYTNPEGCFTAENNCVWGVASDDVCGSDADCENSSYCDTLTNKCSKCYHGCESRIQDGGCAVIGSPVLCTPESVGYLQSSADGATSCGWCCGTTGGCTEESTCPESDACEDGYASSYYAGFCDGLTAEVDCSAAFPLCVWTSDSSCVPPYELTRCGQIADADLCDPSLLPFFLGISSEEGCDYCAVQQPEGHVCTDSDGCRDLLNCACVAYYSVPYITDVDNPTADPNPSYANFGVCGDLADDGLDTSGACGQIVSDPYVVAEWDLMFTLCIGRCDADIYDCSTLFADFCDRTNPMTGESFVNPYE